jgi:hypothetical protein
MEPKNKDMDSALTSRGYAKTERDFFRSFKAERLNYQNFATHHEGVENVESYTKFALGCLDNTQPTTCFEFKSIILTR